MGVLDGGRASDPRGYLEDLLAGTDFLTAARRLTPDLVEEVEGLSEGAGLSFADAFALQLIDEEWAFSARRTRARARDKCSSLAILGTDGAPTLIGQTMDLGAYTDGFQVLLRLAADGSAPDRLVFSVAGVIGLMGVNAGGLGVCVNALFQVPTAPQGLPVAFCLRSALTWSNARDAADFLRRTPHASGQHYLLADPAEIVSLEASAAEVAIVAPLAPGRFLHTNHPLTAAVGPGEVNSRTRLASLQARLAVGRPGLDQAMAALCSLDDPDHPVCRRKSATPDLTNFTTGAIISELGPREVRSFVSFGPPADNPFRELDVTPTSAHA